MAKNKLNPIIEAQRKELKQKLVKVMKLAAVESVNFFTDNFKRQGFLDRTTIPWKPRKRKDKNPKRRAILVKSGTLRRSISKRVTFKRAVIGLKGPASVYGAVHNFGLRAGRGRGFKMPKRQFIGRSHKLDKKITGIIRKGVNKIF